MHRILYVEGCRDGTVGGSHTCLLNLVANLDRTKVDPFVVFYDNHVVADTLRRRGIDPWILPNVSPYSFSRSGQRPTTVNRSLATGAKFAQKAANLIWHFTRPALRHAIAIRANRIQLVHLNNSLNTNHEWMLAARLARVPVVSHERGISLSLSPTARLFARLVHAIVCMSEVIRRPLLTQGIALEKATVIYDGIDAARLTIQQDARSIRLKHGIEPSDPVIGVLGNIKQWKGQDTVVRAVAILRRRWPHIRCLLVGGGPAGDPFLDYVKSLVKGLALESNVLLTGFQDAPADYLNAMDVVIHSSVEPEPFGMVNLEAMYLRKPCVSTTIGGPTEIFDSGADGFLIAPGDPDALADSVGGLLADPALCRQIGEAAHDKVASRFLISHTVEQIETLYDSLLMK